MSKGYATRRRWFSYSLSTLFVVVTVCAVWLGWELSYIRERQAWLRENRALLVTGSAVGQPIAAIPIWRIWLGDETVPGIAFHDDWSDEKCSHAGRLFSEANLFRVIGGQVDGQPGVSFSALVPYEPKSSEQLKALKASQYGPQPSSAPEVDPKNWTG